jgi:hypothetical protein
VQTLAVNREWGMGAGKIRSVFSLFLIGIGVGDGGRGAGGAAHVGCRQDIPFLARGSARDWFFPFLARALRLGWWRPGATKSCPYTHAASRVTYFFSKNRTSNRFMTSAAHGL